MKAGILRIIFSSVNIKPRIYRATSAFFVFNNIKLWNIFYYKPKNHVSFTAIDGNVFTWK